MTAEAVVASPTTDDPLAAGVAAFTKGFDELTSSEDNTSAEAGTAEAEGASDTTSDTKSAGPTPEAPRETASAAATAEAAAPLSQRDEDYVAQLRANDPNAYSAFMRRLQGIEDRAAERAYQRLQKAQVTQNVLDKAPSMQADYAALAPAEREAWVETLPEFISMRAAVASDLVELLGADVSKITPAVLSDVDQLRTILLSGTAGQSHASAAVKAEQARVAKAIKDAEEAGKRIGRAEVRAGSSLPPTGNSGSPSTAAPRTADEAMKALREGLAALTIS